MKEPCRTCPRREIDLRRLPLPGVRPDRRRANTDPACSLSPLHEEWAKVAEVKSHHLPPDFIYRRPGGATPKPAAQKTPVPSDA